GSGWIWVQPCGQLLRCGVGEGLAQAEWKPAIDAGYSVAVHDLVVENSNAGADHRLVVTERTVGEAQTRRKVFLRQRPRMRTDRIRAVYRDQSSGGSIDIQQAAIGHRH